MRNVPVPTLPYSDCTSPRRAQELPYIALHCVFLLRRGARKELLTELEGLTELVGAAQLLSMDDVLDVVLAAWQRYTEKRLARDSAKLQA